MGLVDGKSESETRRGEALVATYLSMHIIACMTRQALNQLIATLQAAEEVRFIRANASQMAGRLLCEFEAPDQDTLLRVLDTHHVTYEWIIRAEMTWGEPLTASAAPTASDNQRHHHLHETRHPSVAPLHRSRLLQGRLTRRNQARQPPCPVTQEMPPFCISSGRSMMTPPGRSSGPNTPSSQ